MGPSAREIIRIQGFRPKMRSAGRPDDRMTPLIRYLLTPLTGAALVVLVLFALLFGLARAAGLFGLWLGIALLAPASGYAFSLLDAMAEGRRRPPELSARLLNPLNERRPLWLAGAILVGFGLTEAVRALAPGVPAALAGGLLVALLPAAIALLGLRLSDPLHVFNPMTLLRIVRDMGTHYLAVIAAAAIAAFSISLAATAPISVVLANFVTLYALFAVFSVVGGSLYLRRSRLGTETVDSPEQREEHALLENKRERDLFLDGVYRRLRAGRRQSAYDQITARLASSADDLAEHAAIFDALIGWDDASCALDVGRELIRGLIEARRSPEALLVAKRCLAQAPEFRPDRAAETLRLANEARDGGEPRVALKLLEGFEARYPGDPALPLAARLRSTSENIRPRPGPGSGS